MRLREPFSGYKLSSGHYLFHLAYLVGSYLPMNMRSDQCHEDYGAANRVMQYLRVAHLLVPVFNLFSYISVKFENYSLEKFFEVITIWQYQATIFLAQYHQVNSDTTELVGFNLWFTIEIVSFYGYLFAAIIFIFET